MSKGRREPICKFICCLCRIPAFLPLFTHLLSGHSQTPANGFWGTTFPRELRALAGTRDKHKGEREKPENGLLQKDVFKAVGQQVEEMPVLCQSALHRGTCPHLEVLDPIKEHIHAVYPSDFPHRNVFTPPTAPVTQPRASGHSSHCPTDHVPWSPR